MYERFSRNAEYEFWKGPDIEIAESVIVNHSAFVPIVLSHASLPYPYTHTRWSVENFRDVMRNLYPSVRSRYAQLGININDHVMREIEYWLRGNSHTDEKGYVLDNIAPVIDVENFGSRPVRLDKGVRLFRFHEEPSSFGLLKGDDLKDAVKSGDIKIKGERLGAWTYSFGKDYKEGPIGIFVYIKRDNRKWIPPDSEAPIVIPDAGEYRKTIDSLLSPIPEEKYEKILWIGETVEMTLSPKIDAILDKVAIRDIYEGISDSPKNGIQINARLIDGGKTAWPVRVEILSNTLSMPQYVHFRFIDKNAYQGRFLFASRPKGSMRQFGW